MPFSYEHITESFVLRLVDTVLRAESTVLTGPRYSGKRHVLFLLQRLLTEQEITPIVAIHFLDQSPLQTEREVRDRIRDAVAQVDPDLRTAEEAHITEPIQSLADKHRVPVVLLASNVDGMAHHLARTFLEGVRTLVDKQQAIAVMSGENDFHQLVYGPKSEFNVASQFFVKGYGEAEFISGLNKYIERLHFNIVDRPAVLNHLWVLTGGNLHIARIFLSALVESQITGGRPAEDPITVADLPPSFKQSAFEFYDNLVFRHARQLLDREETCWSDLQALMEGNEISLPVSSNAPTHVELAGIATRELKNRSIRIKFASPIMEEYVKLTYDDRRLGDLYGRINKWPEAFAHYGKLSAEARIRPASSDDRNEVEATVNSMSASLYSEATRFDDGGPSGLLDRLKQLFAEGCHYLLGFREVTFWFRDLGVDAKWNCIPLDMLNLSDAELSRIEDLLPSDSSLTPGIFPLPADWSQFAVAAILRTLSSEQQAAVVVGDFAKRPIISQEREILAARLLRHFERAYSHALQATHTQIRSRVRGKQIAIINDIFSTFRHRHLSVQLLLRMAARGLRELNYRRVLFSMVDSESAVLEGVVDDCDPPLKSVAHLIKYSLADAANSVQMFTLARKQETIVKDATRDRMADQVVVSAGEMKAFAIIPILTPENEGIGTLLVEKHKTVPDKDEVEDLRIFCDQLALAIEHCQRVYLLQSGLDLLPDPIFIVDSAERPRFANVPAAKLLEVPAGWQNQTRQVSEFDRQHAGPVMDIIHEALSSGHRLASHIEGIGRHKDYRGAVVASAINETWHGADQQKPQKTVGGLLRIQDLTYLYKVFEASRHIAEAESQTALHNMLEAAMELGHERSRSAWGRLYLTRRLENGDEEFFSSVCSGFTEKRFEQDFNDGRVILASRSQVDHYDWMCIEQKAPVVFCWNDEGNTGDICITQNGLKAVNWKAPDQPEQIAKKPGDFWIDFPLLSKDGNSLGKICLQCDDDLQPENFVYLKALCETFSRMLETFKNFERTNVLIRKETAQKSLSLLAHNLSTRLGSFSIYLDEYRGFEEQLPSLKDTNDSFEHAYSHASEAIRRANELLKPVNPNRQRLDLAKHIEKSLQAALPRNTWSMECESRPFYVVIDIQLFEMALLELIKNSKDAAPDLEKMRIDIQLSSTGGGRAQPMAALRYRDNGPGIPSDFGEQVFDDFYSRRPGKDVGTGLGLGYVRRVIEAHGGIVVNNASAKSGVEFIITLPR